MELISIALIAITFLLAMVVTSLDFQGKDEWNPKKYVDSFKVIWLIAIGFGIIVYVVFRFFWGLDYSPLWDRVDTILEKL